MAITRTPDRYKGFIFDGVDSRDYGIYITDGSVFGAPERDVEMIEIPGRNGAFALDKGRFKNIEVTYNAGLYFDNETDFATAINSLRAELCSRKGYCRLEDDVHPDEYRMAVYKSGLEIDTNLRSSDFKIVFDCMPQRYLTSGESAVTVTNGGTLTNPTLFEAKPLLQVWGYGKIKIDGNIGEIEISYQPIGNVLLAYAETNHNTPSLSVDLNTDLLNVGDSMTANVKVTQRIVPDGSPLVEIQSITRQSGSLYSNYEISSFKEAPSTYHNGIYMQASDDLSLVNGTPYSDTTILHVACSGGLTFDYTITTSYDGGDTITVNNTVTSSATYTSYSSNRMMNMYGYSTKSALGNPLYFDLDIGEAYKDESGHITSVNNAVSFPAELPVLHPGANRITFSNTVTQLKVVPRWWCV